ncbi:MAG: low molecular weight protein-tyrosine-phosphatase [Candidatus Nanopelagicales bacterium]
MQAIAMVCLGNICRSPMAEHVLRRKIENAGLDVRVASSGTGDWHLGEAANPKTAQVLKEHGYTYDHTAKQFQMSWFDEFDLILVMDKSNLSNVLALASTEEQKAKVKLLREFDATAGSEAEVPDPYSYPIDAYYEVLDMVEAACDGVVELLLQRKR